ncbi:BadF/BadG/BcrA/BcrD ATPase family protein [Microbulbifer sp. Q7]|uniref:BadF/BadG/BcrA/BcrD ATPase family protein n=1 Tax=Microbulbifer sp. Q7 TaxID=1785091 RepID=UPI00082AED95|nr:BadF/BadG/BcrA/BcrD ATPase family protein [Microbulbifer sp. Q7]
MNGYFLGIDGGGTKTLARLEDAHGERLTLKSGASSLTQDLDGAINNIAGLSRQVLARERVHPNQVHLACGVAGAGNPASAEKLRQRLCTLGFASVQIASDAQTSLLGAGAGTPIVMVAIGTGSVAMRLGRNGEIRQYGGWGLAVGDEGSGAAIGKSLVRALLWELDTHGRAVSALCQQVMTEVGEQRAQILPWLQQAGSREYAALAPAVFSHLPECPLARDIIGKTAAEVDRLIQAASGDENLPLAILGGLADKLSPHLHPDHQQRQIPPLGTALDGACMLARQKALAHSIDPLR